MTQNEEPIKLTLTGSPREVLPLLMNLNPAEKEIADQVIAE
jgi:hypothetical protein